MRWPVLLWLLLCAMCAHAEPVRVGALIHATTLAGSGDEALRASLAAVQSYDPAFVVVNGLKDIDEPCEDRLFRRRKAMLEAAEVPVFLSMAGTDWLGCRNRRGRPAALVWLNLLRDQLYGSISWNGAKQIDIKRQSAIPAFRSYAENTRWSWQELLFATLHLPAENNHYVAAAGSNSEFEDRLTANRYWLKRLASEAQSLRPKAIVIFSDGQVMRDNSDTETQRDGFVEIRRSLLGFAQKMSVPVLLVQGPGGTRGSGLQRSGNLYHVSLPAGVSLLDIDGQDEPAFRLLEVSEPGVEAAER